MKAKLSYKVRKLAKGLLPFYLFTFLPLLTGCSDFLEITPQEIIVLDKFWNEETDVENMVAGCYSRMQRESARSSFWASSS